MPPKNKGGRPARHGVEMSQRATLLLTEAEHASLLAFAKEKKWSISVLLRDALEKTLPDALKAKKN